VNYFALAGAILSALIALWSLSQILRTQFGQHRFTWAWAFPLNALLVAGFGTAAVAWFNVAVGP
jgi:hypothetical protein